VSRYSESGFAAVEAFLIVVIMAIVGGTGYFVWHARLATDQSLAQADKTSKQTIAVAKRPDTVAQKIKDSDVAAKFVKKTYVTYVTSLNNDHNHNVSLAIDTIKSSLSDALRVNLIGKSRDSDPVLCSSETVDPAKVAVVSVIPSYSVIGADVDTGLGNNQATIQVNYDISTRKIVDITCLFPQT
jgi:hypothetical protein